MKYLKKFETNKFVGPNGEFKPSRKKKEGEISIEYLEELCEYLYYHNNLSDKEKLKDILNMEKIIRDILKGDKFVKGGIKYKPIWSAKLKKDMGINESRINEIEIKFVSKRNQTQAFNVYKTPDGRITRIEMPKHVHVRFPFVVGQVLNRSVETWACNNNFYINGEDTCPEEKVFGIRKKDIPQGHELRHLFPNKFR